MPWRYHIFEWVNQFTSLPAFYVLEMWYNCLMFFNNGIINYNISLIIRIHNQCLVKIVLYICIFMLLCVFGGEPICFTVSKIVVYIKAQQLKKYTKACLPVKQTNPTFITFTNPQLSSIQFRTCSSIQITHRRIYKITCQISIKITLHQVYESTLIKYT